MKNNSIQYSWYIDQAVQLEKFGKMFADSLQGLPIFEQLVIYLQGNLGAGKTTFSRAIIQQLGEKGHVRSPSFSIAEIYVLSPFTVLHLDLYRCQSMTDWSDLGLMDYCDQPNVIWLIEWPENAAGSLPVADVHISLEILEIGRKCVLTINNHVGKQLIEPLAQQLSR